MEIIKFLKLRRVKLPTRETSFSAAINFYMPFANEDFVKKLVEHNPNVKYNLVGDIIDVMIEPQDTVLIPSGLKVCINPGTMLIAENKSGNIKATGLSNNTQVIDVDFDKEIHFSLTNVSDKTVVLSTGNKLGQFIQMPVLLNEIQQIEEEEFNEFHESLFNESEEVLEN